MSRGKEKEYAEVSASCIAETPLALLVIVDLKEHWVPKSVVSDDSMVQTKGDLGALVIEEWFAVKEGLE